MTTKKTTIELFHKFIWDSTIKNRSFKVVVI